MSDLKSEQKGVLQLNSEELLEHVREARVRRKRREPARVKAAPTQAKKTKIEKDVKKLTKEQLIALMEAIK